MKSQAFETGKPKGYMGQRISFDDTKKFIHSLPGPGAHDASPKAVHRAAPVFSMGARLQTMRNTTAIVPGPGNYVNNAEKLRRTSPSFGFGTSKRPEIGATKVKVPGPGAYKLPVKIQNTPEYALPNRSPDSKYV